MGKYMFYNNNKLLSLDNEDNQRLLYEMINGNKEVRDELIIGNIRLVLFRVYENFCRTGYDRDDLISIGLIGLINAVDTFDLNKKFHFSTYAMTCIDNAINTYIRNNKKHTLVYSIDSPSNIEDNIPNLYTIISEIDLENDLLEQDMIAVINRIIDSFPDKEKNIFKLFFGLGVENRLTQREIAEIYLTSKANISRIIIKYLNIIRNNLSNMEHSNKSIKKKKK